MIDSPQDAARGPQHLSVVHRLRLLDSPAAEAFDRLTRLAAKLARAPIAFLSLVDRDRTFCLSQRGLPEPLASARQLAGETLCHYVIRSGRPLVVGDTRTDPDHQVVPGIRALGAAAYMGIPLRMPTGEVLGTLCVADSEPRLWTEEEIEDLEDLADSALTEIEYRREVAEHRRAQALLLEEKELLERIACGRALPEILDLLVRGIERQSEGARCSVLLLDPATNTLHLGAAPNLPEGYNRAIEGLPVREGIGSCGTAAHRGASVYVSDIQSDPLWEGFRDLARAHGLEACWSHPVLDSGGRVLGTFAVYPFARGRPSAHEREAVERAAHLVAVAVERTRAGADLAAAEAHYRRLVQTSPLGIFVLDGEGRITEVNPAGERIVLRRAGQFLGQQLRGILTPRSLPRAEEAFTWVMSGQRESIDLEVWVRRSSGERRLVHVLATAIREEGRITGVHGLARDITEERTREAQMRLLTTVLDRLEQGVSIVDAQSRRGVYANAATARLLGCDPGTYHEHRIEEYLPDDAAREQFREIEHSLRETGQWSGRVRWRNHDQGKMIPLDMVAGAVRGEEGQMLFFNIMQDASESVTREKHLRRVERLASVGTLIGGVAHELNNPLSAVLNFAQLMLMDPRDEADREALGIIRHESKRMAKIVTDLRQIARSTQEQARQKTAVDLNEIVRHVLRVQGYRLETSDIVVQEDLASDLPELLGDRSELEQVVLNLVINAEQAMAAHAGRGQLTLRTRASTKGASLHVVDDGPGISPDQLERIWDPFWTTKSPGEGTGLGLSLVHSIVSEHGGEIHVDSQLGSGTAFRVDLPRAARMPSATAPQLQERAPTGHLRVLVVDDEVAVRKAMARYLERRGHLVHEAAGGAAALQMLDARNYDVVLSDLRMPGLGGEAIMERLRERRLSHRLVVMTGDTGGAGARLQRLGIPVLLKPVELSEVARAVEGTGSTG